MLRRILVSTLLIIAIACVPQAMLAATASQDKLKKVETEMAWQKKKADDLDKQKKIAAGDLQELKRKLISATQALEAKEDEQEQVEDRLHGLEKEIAEKNAALAQSRREL